MTRKEKLVSRFYRKPKDFTWDELVSLLSLFGFEQVNSGKTRGSRRRFIHSNGLVINLHEPHPQKILKRYQIELILEILENERFL